MEIVAALACGLLVITFVLLCRSERRLDRAEKETKRLVAENDDLKSSNASAMDGWQAAIKHHESFRVAAVLVETHLHETQQELEGAKKGIDQLKASLAGSDSRVTKLQRWYDDQCQMTLRESAKVDGIQAEFTTYKAQAVASARELHDELSKAIADNTAAEEEIQQLKLAARKPKKPRKPRKSRAKASTKRPANGV